jgi:tetratricopeptide (TPR) repeat protein
MLALLAVCATLLAMEQVQQAPAPPLPEARSLLGKDLERPVPPPDRREKLEAALAEAKARLDACNGPCEEEWIWYGRRTAYLGRFREAILILTTGLDRAETTSRYRHKLLRHRGHRYITIRDFDRAIADLSRAAQVVETEGIADEVEPDGAPNARNIPRSTSHSNIYYHLGLARYLQGNFDGAIEAYRKCLSYCRNDDMLVATTHWLYMSLRRAEKAEEAAKVLEPIKSEMDIVENQAYHRLCLLYKGLIKPEECAGLEGDAIQDVSAAYGVANWYWCSGDRERATELLEKLSGNENWPAFGVIAAEADLARLRPDRK